MGIFNLFTKKQRHTPTDDEIEKAFPGHKATKARQEYQQSLGQRLGAATVKYQEDNDIDSLIREYESVFIESDPPLISSQNLKLVDLYLQQNMNDKAWGYLNRLQSKQEAPLEKIRHEMARILKKEKKYKDALEMIMLEYLDRAAAVSGSFKRDKFIKDAGICTRALKWDDSIPEELANVLENYIRQNSFDEGLIFENFKDYLQIKGLLE